MDAAGAIAELKQITTQIDRAAIARLDGTIEASTLADEAASARTVAAARAMLDAADRVSSRLGRPPLAQLEVSTPEGSVFAVRDAARLVVAVTGADPTVGLIFYDLKTCLRSLAEPEEAATVADDEESG